MPACPTCGLSEWHPPHDVVVPGAANVRLRDVLDEWETQGEKLQLAMSAASAIAARMEELRQVAAAKGVTLAATPSLSASKAAPVGYRPPPADVVVQPDAEDVDFASVGTDELQTLLRTKRVVTQSQVGVGDTHVDDMGLPEAGVRGIASNTGGIGKTAEQIEAEENARYQAEGIATRAGWPAQRQLSEGEVPKPNADQRGELGYNRQQIAELQAGSVEGMDEDGRVFRQNIADRIAHYGTAVG